MRRQTIKKESVRKQIHKGGFTLIELIVVMAVIGILVLLAAPKFLGYTEKARFTRDIHLAKTLETGLEDFMVHGGMLKDHLDVISREDIQKSADKNMLLNPRGFVELVEDGVYYELTHDFISDYLNVKVVKNERINSIIIEAMAATYPVAAYAELGGKALVDRTRGLSGSSSSDEPSGELPGGLNLIDVKQIEAGQYHSLVIMNDGNIKAWGYNESGMLGDGTYSNRRSPVFVQGLEGSPKQLSAGQYHSLAVMEDGSVMSWGGTMGQLANGTTNYRNIAGPADKITGPVKKIVSGSAFALALMEDGTVMAWGHNYFGQVGVKYANRFEATPQTVNGLTGIVKDVAAGEYHVLALMEDGTVMAWGDNRHGQLGDGKTINSFTPVPVLHLQGNVKKLVAGESHSIALMNDGSVKSWGLNNYRQLGDGTTNNSISPVAVTVLGGNVKDVVAGPYHSLALMDDGSIKAWGRASNPETALEMGGRVKELSAGENHSLALMEDGTVKAWGWNNYGQLGIGTHESPSGIVDVKNDDGSIFNINQ